MTRASAMMAIPADSADALLTARRGMSVVVGILLAVLVFQMAGFLLVRFHVVSLERRGGSVASGSAGAGAAGSDSAAVVGAGGGDGGATAGDALRYALPVTGLLGVTMGLVLSAVILLMAAVMLVSRRHGMAQIASAFLWSVVVAVFLFPWQCLLISAEDLPGEASAAPAIRTWEEARVRPPQPAFMAPGVLYTYAELLQDHDFANHPWQQATLKWTRYCVFPGLTVLLLAMVYLKVRRGLNFALGESDVPLEAGYTVPPG